MLIGWSRPDALPSVDVVAAPPFDPPAVRPSVARTATLWVFRFLALLQAILFVLQPISIGSFLQGSWAAFDMHSIVGGLLVLPTMATAAVGLLLAVLARRVWVGVGSMALGVLTTAQVGIGHTGLVSVHVPLGVALVALAVWLCAWSWTKGARWA